MSRALFWLSTSHSNSKSLLLLRFSPKSKWVSSFPNPHPSSSSSSKAQQKGKSSHRLASVVDAINDRKLPPELRCRPNAIRSETDIENVVEHRVWRSMEDGQFDNLPGKGKPLELNTNPHVDPAEDMLYKILSRNGCAPEWVELNKEIRSLTKAWRSAMKKAWLKRSEVGDSSWTGNVDQLKAQMSIINSKVLHYNVIVPFGRQLCGLKWEKEIETLKSE